MTAMTKRALVCFLPATFFALAACEKEPARTETTTLEEPSGQKEQCMERFADRGVWGTDQVKSSFVYDISALEGEPAHAFWGGDPAEFGQHTAKIVEGEAEDAEKQFLEGEPVGSTELFQAGDLVLMRVNDPAALFDTALRRGCDRLREGVTVKQVTFSKE
jgi:hypothetical protein